MNLSGFICCLICFGYAGQRVQIPTTQSSPVGSASVVLPPDWRRLEQASPGMVYACDSSGRAFVWIYSESKADFVDLPPATYLGWIAKATEAQLTDSRRGNVCELRVDGLPALQMDLSGTHDHVQWRYVVTVIEAEGALHVVTVCCGPTGLSAALPALDQILASFSIDRANSDPPATAPSR